MLLNLLNVVVDVGTDSAEDVTDAGARTGDETGAGARVGDEVGASAELGI